MEGHRHDAAWPVSRIGIVIKQARLATMQRPAWRPETLPLDIAAAVVVSGRSAETPDQDSELTWTGAVLMRGSEVLDSHVVKNVAATPYIPGLLALREGQLLCAAITALRACPDVLIVAAAGRDHPRQAGLALHLGAVLGIPSIGITDRPLMAQGTYPGPRRGDTSTLLLDDIEVAQWVRTVTGVRPLVAHAGWCTTAEVAAAVLLSCTSHLRAPQPLREARRLARLARNREQNPNSDHRR
ncbi:endonuclease V [Arthrobacter sp. VKM Ac-2550]|uniref:endonuclease V n=1 Tax=Crystallibacter permensis TaxID=1938888 RepID=UPI0039B438EB